MNINFGVFGMLIWILGFLIYIFIWLNIKHMIDVNLINPSCKRKNATESRTHNYELSNHLPPSFNIHCFRRWTPFTAENVLQFPSKKRWELLGCCCWYSKIRRLKKELPFTFILLLTSTCCSDSFLKESSWVEFYYKQLWYL